MPPRLEGATAGQPGFQEVGAGCSSPASIEFRTKRSPIAQKWDSLTTQGWRPYDIQPWMVDSESDAKTVGTPRGDEPASLVPAPKPGDRSIQTGCLRGKGQGKTFQRYFAIAEVCGYMSAPETIPNGRILLAGLGLNLERFRTGSKAAISLPVLKAVLSAAAAALPFDEEFYLDTYQDVREAHEAGKIKDVHAHFVETGYFEGRMGSTPDFDEQFYRGAYPDVAAAITRGGVKSGLDHFIQSGAAEGRHPNAKTMEVNRRWAELLRP